MTPEQIAALRAAAEKATPGDWAAGSTKISTIEEAVAICRENIEKTRNPTRHFCELYTSEGNGLRIALVGHGPNSIPNVEYLALANPKTILALIDYIAKLEAERDAVLEEACGAIKAVDDKQSEDNYMLDSDDCIRVIRALKSTPLTDDQRHEAVAKILKEPK